MLALLVVPVIEVFIIIKVGQSIGGWPTLALLLLWSGLGAWVVKREFSRAFGALRSAFGGGRMPARELSDAALILIGGTLLLAPGFLTDALGLFFLLPFTRPLARRVLERAVAAKLVGSAGMTGFVGAPFGARRPFDAMTGAPGSTHEPYPNAGSFARRRTANDVVEGEIID